MITSSRFSWIVPVLLLGSPPACTRGKSAQELADAASARAIVRATHTAISQPAATGPRADDEDWAQGKLPAVANQGPAVSGGVLTVAVNTDPPSLNTNLDADLVAAWITTHRIYQALVSRDPFDDPRYAYVPELAERWEISADKKTYTFHLRHDVKWHDGQPFTARDVIASLDKIQDLTTRADHVRAALAELAAYRALDDYTVVTVWKRPYAFTLDSLADINIQPAHLIGKLSGRQWNQAASNPTNRAPVGTGPFKFVAWETENKIVLERNDEYWGEKPFLDRLIFRIVPDATVRLQLAERGEVDVVHPVTPEQWARMDSPALRRDWNRSRFFPAQYAWMGWNEARALFSDKRVRRALTMLVDRPGIIDKMLYGLPRPTTCHFYWASAQCDQDQKPLPYDRQAAGLLLDEAGWTDSDGDGIRDKDGKPFRFVLMLPAAAGEAVRFAAKVKEDMAHAGVVLDIQQVQWASFMRRLSEHNFDACALVWGGGPREDPTPTWHSSSMRGGSNYVSYSNREVDGLLERARVEFDVAVRDGLYRQVGAILHEEQPYTWMYSRPELNLIHKRVRGAEPNLFWWQFERMWIEPGTIPHT